MSANDNFENTPVERFAEWGLGYAVLNVLAEAYGPDRVQLFLAGLKQGDVARVIGSRALAVCRSNLAEFGRL